MEEAIKRPPQSWIDFCEDKNVDTKVSLSVSETLIGSCIISARFLGQEIGDASVVSAATICLIVLLKEHPEWREQIVDALQED